MRCKAACGVLTQYIPCSCLTHGFTALNKCAAGVHEAIQLKYLKALHFGFSLDAQGENLLEEYVYHFAYDGSKVQLTANGTDISLSQSAQVTARADPAYMRMHMLHADTVRVAPCRTTSRR